MRRAARVDTSQGPIVAALEGVGAKVWHIGRELDALILFRGQLYLVDFKSSRTAARTLTQRRFVADGWPVYFWSSVDEALKTIGAVE